MIKIMTTRHHKTNFMSDVECTMVLNTAFAKFYEQGASDIRIQISLI